MHHIRGHIALMFSLLFIAIVLMCINVHLSHLNKNYLLIYPCHPLATPLIELQWSSLVEWTIEVAMYGLFLSQAKHRCMDRAC